MRKRLISICTIALLLYGIYGCAQTAEETLAAETEFVKTEYTDAAYAEQWLSGHGYVTGIRITSITQEDVDRIAGMEDIDTLSFVKELRYLTTIYFDKCTSLEDLSFFEDMLCLKDLHVGYVDDVDLNYLSGCVNLESIDICGHHIRNVEGLSGLMSLHSLGLFDSASEEPIMNDLEQISELKGLEDVTLRFIDVPDAGLLSNLPNLRRIFLVGTGISDIELLNNLERLEYLAIF